jgi:hypothetical protein
VPFRDLSLKRSFAPPGAKERVCFKLPRVMLNKRKALIGYLVYAIGKPVAKRVLKRKAKAAVPGTREGSRVPNTSAIVAAVGALLGGLLFWRKRRGREEESPQT